MSKKIFCVVFCFVFSFFSIVNIIAKEVKVTYIANEGFLISTPEHGILIDALFSESFGEFMTPPDEIVQKIMDGVPPFDKIDLFLITHEHADHVNYSMVSSYLKKHPDVILISNKATLDNFKTPNLYETLKNQLREAKSSFGDTDEFSINGMNIKSFCDVHIGGNVQNLEFLIDIEGIKILHTGDMSLTLNETYLKNFQLEKSEINLLLLNYFSNSEEDRQIVESYINPEKTACMHLSIYNYETDLNKFKKIFPKAVIFQKPMDKIILKNK